MHLDTQKKFDKWMKEFVKHRPCGVPDKAYFDDVNSRHNHIRSKLGGISKHFDIQIAANCVIDIDAINRVKCDLNYFVPGLVGRSNRLLTAPTFVDEYGRTQKTGKFLRKKAEQILKKRYKTKKPIVAGIIGVEKTINRLCGIWDISIVKDETMSIEITTCPSAFVQLGTYRPDNSSCFGPYQESEFEKYLLAVVDDSFVVLFKNKGKIVGRCWGIYDHDNDALCFSNFYFHGVRQIQCNVAIGTIVLDVFGNQYKREPKATIDETCVYTNGDEIIYSSRPVSKIDIGTDVYNIDIFHDFIVCCECNEWVKINMDIRETLCDMYDARFESCSITCENCCDGKMVLNIRQILSGD